jgi:large subunit ribosomal protein L6
MVKQKLSEKIELMGGITASFENSKLTIKGPKGEITKTFESPIVNTSVEGNSINLSTKDGSKRSKAMIKTYKAHVNNALKGLNDVYVYKLKICSGHFPMNISVSNNVLEIKNYVGEKVPRKVQLDPSVSVKIDGQEIVVESPDKDKAGQTAANIEQSTRRPGFDKRIFQDGIYITDKAGKAV